MSYNTLIKKIGTTYYAYDNAGTQLTTKTTAHEIIQFGLDRQGVLHIQRPADNYPVGSALFVKSDTRVIVDQGTEFLLANGYNGTVWYFEDGVTRSSIE